MRSLDPDPDSQSGSGSRRAKKTQEIAFVIKKRYIKKVSAVFFSSIFGHQNPGSGSGFT